MGPAAALDRLLEPRTSQAASMTLLQGRAAAPPGDPPLSAPHPGEPHCSVPPTRGHPCSVLPTPGRVGGAHSVGGGEAALGVGGPALQDSH